MNTTLIRLPRPVVAAETSAALRRIPRLLIRPADLCSIEASFVLFLVSGRYKTLSGLNNSPVDFTVLFLVFTLCLVVLALASGRLRFSFSSLPVFIMVLFTQFALVSLFWSSFQAFNIDKALRFASLTSTSFFVAYFISSDPLRRERFLRVLLWFSVALLLYYFYYEYIVGIEIPGPPDKPTYQDFGEHAEIVSIAFLVLAVFGSSWELWLAILGGGASLWALAVIGDRGALVFAMLAAPLLASGLALRSLRSLSRLARLAIFLALLAVTCGAGFLAVRANAPAVDFSRLRTISRFEAHLSGEDTSSMDERARGRQEALDQWLRKPVFGWGIGEFRVQQNYLKYPHNLLLEILMELGIAGAFLFFWAAGIGVLACVRLASYPSTGWAEAAIGLLFLTQLASELTVEGYLANDRVFLAYMGLTIGCARFGQKRASPPSATARFAERQRRLSPAGPSEPAEATRWSSR